METLKGKSVFASIAIGKISIYKKKAQKVKRIHIEDTRREIDRFEEAKGKAVKQLKELYRKALAEVGEANAMIFEVHQMMLEDDDYLESIYNIIQVEKLNAEYAVAATGDNFSKMFADMQDDYMKERAADIKDISERLILNLSGDNGQNNCFSEPVILVAEDLAPSETVQLEKDKILAFVTRDGSTNSHTAILARTMNIPAIIHTGVEISEDWEGKLGVVDGFKGEVCIAPSEEILAKMRELQQEALRKKALLQELKGKENVTKSGQRVDIYANIGSVSDLTAVLENDASGIGLFRSEFLYLEKEDYPTESEQFEVYKKVLETMGGKKVIIRTLDIGADKQIGYFNLDKEENPAMGYRAIRICLDRTEIFKTQLRALYRASAYGNLSVMIPMIISLDEVLQVKALIEEVKAELTKEGVKYGQVELGIMIETPASVMISNELAKEVDFFSIGTNDLTQYTLAIDRQNPKLDKIYDPHHPAVLNMIEMVIQNAHKNGIWAGICGELGADLTLTERFMKMGIDELSVSPSFILPIRKIVRDME